MYSEQFASRLKEARVQAGLSQADVAIKTKIDRTALSKYENGKLEPNIETIGTLVELYKITTDWLLGIGKK